MIDIIKEWRITESPKLTVGVYHNLYKNCLREINKNLSASTKTALYRIE